MPRKSVQEERRVQILEALHRRLLDRPFHQTSIKDIAQEAGVNHGVLHYYFKNKEDILLKYIDHIIILYKAQYEEWLIARGGAVTNERQFIREILNYMADRITLNRDLSRVFIEIWEIANYDKKVRSKLQKAYMEWVQTVSSVMQKQLGDEKTAGRLSRALVSFFEGMALFSIIMPARDFPTGEILRWFEEQVLRALEL